MATYVTRKLECGLGHKWTDYVTVKGSPVPTECPICQAIVRDAFVPPARSDSVAAPSIRGKLTMSLHNFEQGAFVRPHFDDGKPLMTNLRDNVDVGESYAVPETVSTSETMRMTAEMIQSTEQAKQQGRDTEGAHLMNIGGGWQGANPQILAAAGGPQNLIGRPSVDLQSKKRA